MEPITCLVLIWTGLLNEEDRKKIRGKIDEGGTYCRETVIPAVGKAVGTAWKETKGLYDQVEGKIKEKIR